MQHPIRHRHNVLSVFLPVVLLALAACRPPDTAVQDSAPAPGVVTHQDSVRADMGDPETRRVFERIVQQARQDRVSEREMGEIVQWAAVSLLDSPYRDGMLDMKDEESLVVDLTAFDCVLFNENVLALAQSIALEDYAFETYVRNLERLRYRDGRMGDYCSRSDSSSD
jgi:hypothetical protein